MELNKFRFNFITAVRKDKRLNNNYMVSKVGFASMTPPTEAIGVMIRDKYLKHIIKQGGLKKGKHSKDTESAQQLRSARKTIKRFINCPDVVHIMTDVRKEHKHFDRLQLPKSSKTMERIVNLKLSYTSYKVYNESVTKVLDEVFDGIKQRFANFVYANAKEIDKKLNQPISLKAIKEKATRVWVQGEEGNLAPAAADKNNYVGVEVECISQLNQSKITELLIEKAPSLCKYVRIGHDGSVRVSEKYPFAFEFRIMAKQDMIQGVIQRFFTVLKGIISVNSSCGLHVHLDMRNRNYGQSYERLYTALPTLQSMVPKSRRGNSYCKINEDKKDWTRSGGDRYQAINPQSYRQRRTVEIRLHSATTNPMKVNNWIKLLTLIVDKQFEVDKKTGKPKEPQRSLNSLLSFFTKYEVPSDLRNYITRRIAKFGKAEELRVPKELEPILNAAGTANATTEQDEADDLVTASA